MSERPADRITRAIAAQSQRPALVPFVTGGYPDRDAFRELLPRIAAEADVVEVGVPFTDPMADGVTIQRASERALAGGFTLAGLLADLGALRDQLTAPVVLMSYYNPLLAYGLERLADDASRAGVAGFIVPDLPFEECAELRDALDEVGVALIQLVTPVTPPARRAQLAKESRGFVYAVTMTGTTGKAVQLDSALAYLDELRAVSPLPVCAGFGIRSHAQVEQLRGHVDGAIVGSALLDVLAEGGDGAAFLRELKGTDRMLAKEGGAE